MSLVIVLGVALFYCYAECRYGECRGAAQGENYHHDIQHCVIQRNDIQHYNTGHNDIQLINTQHEELICDTQNKQH